VFKRHNQIGRPCLLGYIDKCSAPCVGRVSAEEHRVIVEDFCDFLAGKTDRLVREMEKQMNAAAEVLDFERAAGCGTTSVRSSARWRSRPWCFGDGTDADVVAFADDEPRSGRAGVPRARRTGAWPAWLGRRQAR